jgi:hypothetical protein
MIYHTPQRGFVALISVLIIGAILLLLVFTLGVSSFLGRIDALTYENKEVSRALAEACVNRAFAELAGDSGYEPPSGGQCIEIGGECGEADPQLVCKICKTSFSGGEYTVRARALYNNSYTNILAEADSDFEITDWVEEGLYGGATCPLP